MFKLMVKKIITVYQLKFACLSGPMINDKEGFMIKANKDVNFHRSVF